MKDSGGYHGSLCILSEPADKQFKNDREALKSVGVDSIVVRDTQDVLMLSQELLCGFCAGSPNPHKTRTISCGEIRSVPRYRHSIGQTLGIYLRLTALGFRWKSRWERFTGTFILYKLC